MGKIVIDHREYLIDCIIFDKDGTLIDFDAFWGPRTQEWVEAMAASLDFGEDFKKEVYTLIGYSKSKNRVRFEGPLAVASMDIIYTLASGVISRYGIPWYQARILAEDCAKSTMLTNLKVGEIAPKGNLVGVMQQLSNAKISVAVVTSDDRQLTEDTLAYLGIRDFVSALVCGDDPIPNKPAPDGIWAIAKQLSVITDRIMMVGDSLSDMQFAANAGAAYRVGITSDPEAAAILADRADAVISSIDELSVFPSQH
jgi:phosphoglycolate phosphatase-like HAD superfamily hydrolase